ncbi:MAG: TIGR02996 domain-containing protein [Planctomycetaceae bacterium]|nr:TIGR02996 domain-containing protein [Planctomycetaceae bacterium]
MESQHQYFFELIREHPEDDMPRLIYADWLDEQGDPRGEFIRIQCELASLTFHDPVRLDMDKVAKLDKREHRLLKKYQKEWTTSLEAFRVQKTKFHRGFLIEVDLCYDRHPKESPSNFFGHWNALIEREPALSCVRLQLYRDWNEIQQLPPAPQIQTLRFNNQALARREISVLLGWPIIRGLSHLDLSLNNLRSGVECVAHAPALDGLKTLDLSFNGIGTRGAKVLASSTYLRGLLSLDLRSNCIGQEGKQKLRMAFGPRVQLGELNLRYAHGRTAFFRPRATFHR